MAMALYIISDLHFDDQWICDELRPFDDVDEMNESLLSNCKSQIDDGDSLLFLGDLVGKNGTEEDVWSWYGALAEIECWIPGDHDHIARSEYNETPLPVRAPFQRDVGGH